MYIWVALPTSFQEPFSSSFIFVILVNRAYNGVEARPCIHHAARRDSCLVPVLQPPCRILAVHPHGPCFHPSTSSTLLGPSPFDMRGYAFISERDDGDAFDIHRLVRLATINWI